MFKIYKLIDPRTNETRYVGITTRSLAARLRDHINHVGRGDDTYKSRWLRGLLDSGHQPPIELVEETEDPEREGYWITTLRAQGCRLTNTCDGGNFTTGLPPSIRKQIGQKLRGRKLAPGHVAKMRLAHLGVKRSPETCAKLSEMRQGKKRGPMKPEHKAAISKANMGRQNSPESIARQASALRGRPTGRTATRCPRGHTYDTGNTYLSPAGKKHCRACRSENKREANRLKREANRLKREANRLKREANRLKREASLEASGGRRCPHGHKFTPENTYHYRNGRIECRTCCQERSRRAYRLKRTTSGGGSSP